MHDRPISPGDASGAPDVDALVDSLYQVALQPERFGELTDVWSDYLGAVDADLGEAFATDVLELGGHIDRASSLIDLADRSAAPRPATLQEQIDSDPQAIMALDAACSVVAINPAGRSLFGLDAGAALNGAELGVGAITEITGMVRARFSESGALRGTMLSLARIATDATTPDGALDEIVMSVADGAASGRPVVVLKTTRFVWPERLDPLMARAFGLTRAETDIVRLLVEGHSVQQVAAARDSQLSTVRAQIRSLYAKTSTRNQSEFTRLALGLATMQAQPGGKEGAAAPDAPRPRPGYPRAEHERILRLPDGRMLDYAVFGDPDGRPCLFFHNEMVSHIWPAVMAEHAARCGLRIILPARPCYGRSDPYPTGPGGLDHPSQTAADFTALLDHLGVERVLLCGVTLGCMFALAMARDHPDRTVGLLCFPPMLPPLDPAHTQEMPRMHRFVATLLLRKPSLVEFIARAGYSFYQRVGMHRFLLNAYGDFPNDRRVLEDPDNFPDLDRALRFGERHGHRGFVAGFSHMLPDALSVMRNLPFPIEAVIGKVDGNNRRVRIDALRAEGVRFNVTDAADGGELLMHSHGPQIVDRLAALWDQADAPREPVAVS